MRANAKRIAALLLTLVLLLGVLPTAAFASGETYKKVTSADELTTGKYVMVVDTGYAPGVLDRGWLSAVNIGTEQETLTDPDPTAVWTITVGDSGVTLTDANGTSVKPKTGNNNGIEDGAYEWDVTYSDGTFQFKGQESDTTTLASNKSSKNQFRAYKNTTVSGNPTGYPSAFTLYKLAEGEGGSEEITVIAPQAQPQAGEVEAGTTIELTCATEGAAIYYTLDGSDPADETNENRFAYAELDGDGITINEDCTLKAAAVKGSVWSEVQVLKYTVKTEEPAETPIADGDHVVIYAPAYNKALSATYNGYYNTGTDVSVAENDTVTGYTDADVWTVIANEDGSWSFAHNGQNIGMGDRYSSMPLGEKNDQWVLEDAGDGLYYIKNTARNVYMEWYAAQNNWSGYGTIASGSEGMFALKFFKVTGSGESNPDPDPVKPTIADGDYVLYVPGYRKALSANYTGYYNMGVDMTLNAENVFDKVQASEVWTLANNTDGTFTLTSKSEGEKLGMDASYSSMPLGSVNNSWTVEDAENGLYYVKNVGRNTYIEWYANKGNFSSYYNIAPDSEGMFAFSSSPSTKARSRTPPWPPVPSRTAATSFTPPRPAASCAMPAAARLVPYL